MRFLIVVILLAIFIVYTYKFVFFIGIALYVALVLWIGCILGTLDEPEENDHES